MRKMRLLNKALAIILVFLVFSFSSIAGAADDKTTQAVSVTAYELDEGDAYKYDKADPVKSMSYGRSSVGTLKISGNIIENKTFSGFNAFGVAGNVSFSYTYDSRLLNAAETQWHIVSDKEKKVNGIKLDSNILSGVLLIQKSYDGQNYENAVNPVLDFFNSKTSGVTLYSTSGSDVSRGVYLRFILAYKTERKNNDTHWYTPFWLLTESHRHMEVYDFYVVEDSGTISIHNLSSDEEILHEDEYTQELLKHGETLVNNSVTRDGFYIEKISSSYTVSVARNGGTAKVANDRARFTEDGKYTITVTTKLGRKTTITVYVFNGGDDKGFSRYFGDGLVQAERVFREGNYPTYSRGGQIAVNAVDTNTPVLRGSLKNLETDQTVFELAGSREQQTFALEPGSYIADFYTGDPNEAGSIYHYTFIFSVLDEESAPYVNYHNLMQTDRLEDLQTKHYEVAYQTTGGGYIYVCFALDSYEEALRYAREIEGRFVEKASDGGFYYKSEENPNRKVKYYDEIALTRVREIYAKRNVEINYFNADDAFTYQTYDNNLLECLESLSISESIKVFPSNEEKEKLFDRTPFINNFTFIQATEYDVVSVEAFCEANGETYNLAFGVPVSQQLDVSSLYRITETNSYGRTSTYDAYFVTECQTIMTWVVTKDETETTQIITAADDGITIEADAAYVSEIANEIDNWAIVTIKAPGVYSFEIKCLASEFLNLEFTKPGVYGISFIDRLGNDFSIKLSISGAIGQTGMKPFTVSYATFYNNLYLNHKDVDEDVYALSELDNSSEEFSIDAYEQSLPSEPLTDANPPAQNNQPDSTRQANILKPIMLVVSFTAFAVFVVAYIVRQRRRLAEKNDDQPDEPHQEEVSQTEESVQPQDESEGKHEHEE